MIRISEFGYRDGDLNVRTINVNQKRFNMDVYQHLLSSAHTIGTLDISASTGTTLVIGTQMECPRALKLITENGGGVPVRRKQVKFKGYTGQGEYKEETITLGTTDNAVVTGSVPFAYVSGANVVDATKAYGTYGTVSVYPKDVFGVTEYINAATDGLDTQITAPDTGIRTVGTTFDTTDAFNKTNQTIKVGGALAGSTLAIRYRSEFQKRQKN